MRKPHYCTQTADNAECSLCSYAENGKDCQGVPFYNHNIVQLELTVQQLETLESIFWKWNNEGLNVPPPDFVPEAEWKEYNEQLKELKQKFNDLSAPYYKEKDQPAENWPGW